MSVTEAVAIPKINTWKFFLKSSIIILVLHYIVPFKKMKTVMNLTFLLTTLSAVTAALPQRKYFS